MIFPNFSHLWIVRDRGTQALVEPFELFSIVYSFLITLYVLALVVLKTNKM